MISEQSCGAEDWSNDYHHRNTFEWSHVIFFYYIFKWLFLVLIGFAIKGIHQPKFYCSCHSIAAVLWIWTEMCYKCGVLTTFSNKLLSLAFTGHLWFSGTQILCQMTCTTEQLLSGFAKVWDSCQRIIKNYARDLFEAVWINLIQLFVCSLRHYMGTFVFLFF